MGTQSLPFLAVCWAKFEKRNKVHVRHNMTQTHVPNILAVATVLIGSWALISIVDSQRSGGGDL